MNMMDVIEYMRETNSAALKLEDTEDGPALYHIAHNGSWIRQRIIEDEHIVQEEPGKIPETRQPEQKPPAEKPAAAPKQAEKAKP